MLINGFVIFNDSIPLVNGDNHALAPLVGDTGNLRILFGDPFGRIDHQKDNIGPLNRSYRTDNAVTFQILFNFIFSIFFNVIFSICSILSFELL